MCCDVLARLLPLLLLLSCSLSQPAQVRLGQVSEETSGGWHYIMLTLSVQCQAPVFTITMFYSKHPSWYSWCCKYLRSNNSTPPWSHQTSRHLKAGPGTTPDQRSQLTTRPGRAGLTNFWCKIFALQSGSNYYLGLPTNYTEDRLLKNTQCCNLQGVETVSF